MSAVCRAWCKTGQHKWQQCLLKRHSVYLTADPETAAGMNGLDDSSDSCSTDTDTDASVSRQVRTHKLALSVSSSCHGTTDAQERSRSRVIIPCRMLSCAAVLQLPPCNSVQLHSERAIVPALLS